MSKVLLNRDLVVNQAKDSFKEQLKQVIYNAASIMDCEEMRDVLNDVTKEMLSFLSSEAKPRNGAKEESK